MLLSLAGSVTFRRKSQISGSEEILCLLKWVANLFSRLWDNVSPSHSFKTRGDDVCYVAEENHPVVSQKQWSRRVREEEGPGRGQRAAWRRAENVSRHWKRTETASGATVWVMHIILMTLQSSYVGEAPPTCSKLQLALTLLRREELHSLRGWASLFGAFPLSWGGSGRSWRENKTSCEHVPALQSENLNRSPDSVPNCWGSWALYFISWDSASSCEKWSLLESSHRAVTRIRWAGKE